MRPLLVTLLVLLAVPPALAQKPEDKPDEQAATIAASPFVGTWDYVVSTTGGDETGWFTIEQHGERLGGTIATDTTTPLAPFVMTGDAADFSFKHPNMGDITIRGTLAGDRFEGEAEIPAWDAIFPFAATRQTDAAPVDQ